MFLKNLNLFLFIFLFSLKFIFNQRTYWSNEDCKHLLVTNKCVGEVGNDYQNYKLLEKKIENLEKIINKSNLVTSTSSSSSNFLSSSSPSSSSFPSSSSSSSSFPFTSTPNLNGFQKFFDVNDSSFYYNSLSQITKRIEKLEKNINSIFSSTCFNQSLLFLQTPPTISFSLTFSSIYGQNGVNITMENAELIHINSENFWCANEPNLDEEYIEIKINIKSEEDKNDEKKKGVKIGGVLTQGRKSYDQWVSTYSIKYSTVEEPEKWINYPGDFKLGDKIFEGNKDKNSLKVNKFSTPLKNVEKLRFLPLASASTGANKCARVDFIICDD